MPSYQWHFWAENLSWPVYSPASDWAGTGHAADTPAGPDADLFSVWLP